MTDAGTREWSDLQRALSGDRPTWDLLVSRHTRAVEVALLAKGQSLPEARELTQAAWALLFQRVVEGRFSRLELPGLAIHQAELLAREQRRALARVPPPDEGHAPPTPEEVVSSRRAIARVRDELAKVPVTARRVFELLHGVPPRTPAEVAVELGLSVQRVRQVLCEVRARLRKLLEEERS